MDPAALGGEPQKAFGQVLSPTQEGRGGLSDCFWVDEHGVLSDRSCGRGIACLPEDLQELRNPVEVIRAAAHVRKSCAVVSAAAKGHLPVVPGVGVYEGTLRIDSASSVDIDQPRR